MTTCKRLNLETLGFWPIKLCPKNLPGHRIARDEPPELMSYPTLGFLLLEDPLCWVPLLARWLGGNQACWLACAWGQGIESNASVRYIIYLDWWSMWWCNCGEGGFGFCILRSFGGACPWLPSTQAHAFIALGATKCTWPLPSSYWYLYATQFFFNLKKFEAIFSTNFAGFWFRNIYWGGNSVTCLMYVGCWFIPI